MSDMELLEKSEELRKYAELDGCEYGEYCLALIAAVDRFDFASEDFINALDKELTSHLSNFKENSTIVEHEETFTRKVVDLEWR